MSSGECGHFVSASMCKCIDIGEVQYCCSGSVPEKHTCNCTADTLDLCLFGTGPATRSYCIMCSLNTWPWIGPSCSNSSWRKTRTWWSHSQYHTSWQLPDTRSQAISGQGINLVLEYSLPYMGRTLPISMYKLQNEYIFSIT